jgi:hypothetical protein
MGDNYRILLTFLRGCRGLFDRATWLVPRMTGFVRSLMSASISVAAMIKVGVPIAVPSVKDVLLLLSLFSLVSAILGFISFSLHKFSIELNPEASHIKPVAQQPAAIYENVGQAMWTDPVVNRVIDEGDNKIDYVKKLRPVDPRVSSFLPQFILGLRNERTRAGLGTFDEKKLGLLTDITLDVLNRKGKIVIQRTSYFRDRLSNGLLNWRVRLKGRVAFDFVDGAFVRVKQPDGSTVWQLKDLANSELSNQLGASALLITSDAYVVYLMQAGRSAENADKLAPSGSGSFDGDNIKSFLKQSLQQFVRAEMTRELCEECGLRREDIAAVQICGFGRYLYRAGKPEFFCVATTSKTYNDVSVPTRELDWQHKSKYGMRLTLDRSAGIASVRSELAEGLEKHASELENNHATRPVSGPLLWNIRVAVDYLRHASDGQLGKLLQPLISAG